MRNREPKILWLDLCKNEHPLPCLCGLKQPVTICKFKLNAIDIHDARALSIIAQNDPQLICFDCDFPDLPQLQFIRQVRTLYSQIPVIMLTVQHSENLAVWAFRTGVRNYWVKPMEERVMVEEIGQFTRLFKSMSRRPRINLLKRYPIPREFQFLNKTSTLHRTSSAINYVEKHFQEKIAARTVAALCGISIYTFSRIFHKEYHQTFRDYLTEYRIKRAQTLLANPNISITDTAQLCGFDDPSRFSRLFRRHCGLTPSQFQKNHAALSSTVKASVLTSKKT